MYFLHSLFPFKKEQTHKSISSTWIQIKVTTSSYISSFFFLLRSIFETMMMLNLQGNCVCYWIWIDVQCIDHVKLFWKQELLFFIIILLIFLLLEKVLIFMNFLWFLFCGVCLFSLAYGSVTQVRPKLYPFFSFLLFLLNYYLWSINIDMDTHKHIDIDNNLRKWHHNSCDTWTHVIW